MATTEQPNLHAPSMAQSNVAPRIAWNEKCAKTFELKPEYPAVAKQLEEIWFNRRALKPFGYNPSIIQFGERILLAYRYHPDPSWISLLAMVELSKTFKILRHKTVEIVGSGSMEDPHLFVHKGALWMSWVQATSTFSEMGFSTAMVKYGQLVESKDFWAVPTAYRPNYGHNDAQKMEKNWVFMSEDGNLRFIYEQSPNLVECLVDGGTAMLQHQTAAVHWPWGRPKGGCAVGDTRFFHSTLDNQNNATAVNNPFRQYYIGANVAGKQSSKPLLYGSEEDELSETEKKSCHHYKSNVVFCSGAIAMPDSSFILSVGVNDSACVLLRAKKGDLHIA